MSRYVTWTEPLVGSRSLCARLRYSFPLDIREVYPRGLQGKTVGWDIHRNVVNSEESLIGPRLHMVKSVTTIR